MSPKTKMKKKGFDRKFGRILIRTKTIHNVDVLIDALYKIRFFPIRVEHLFVEDAFEMIGYSERFAKVPMGQVLPNYELIVKTDPKTGELKDVEVR